MRYLLASLILFSLFGCAGNTAKKSCVECGSWTAAVHTEGAPDSLVLNDGGYFKFYYTAGNVPFDSLTGKYQIDTVKNTFRTFNYTAQNVFAIESLQPDHFVFTDSSGHRFEFVKAD